jgi:hypothetical protein
LEAKTEVLWLKLLMTPLEKIVVVAAAAAVWNKQYHLDLFERTMQAVANSSNQVAVDAVPMAVVHQSHLK